MEHNNKTTHWVGHSKLKSLCTEYFPNKFIDEIQFSLTGTTIEQSDYGGKKNSYSLQKYEEQEDEESNYDTDVTEESNKIDKDIDDMIISMK